MEPSGMLEKTSREHSGYVSLGSYKVQFHDVGTIPADNLN